MQGPIWSALGWEGMKGLHFMLHGKRQMKNNYCFSNRFGVFTLVASVVLALSISSVSAQKAQKKAPAAKKEKSSVAWIKLCDTAEFAPKDPNSKAKPVKKKLCLVRHETLDGRTGLVVVSAAIRIIEGQKINRLIVQVPLGVSIRAGISVGIDDHPEYRFAYMFCHTEGCTAEAEASEEMITRLKKGKALRVTGINMRGQQFVLPVTLSGFGSAFAGKAADSKKYYQERFATQRALMTNFRKRQAERLKKAREEQKKKQAEKKTK